jgi:hypothetical protein
VNTRKRAHPGTAEGPLVTTGKQPGGITGKVFLPGRSGNAAGQPAGDARMRGLMNEALRLSRKDAIEALRRRWASPRYVQDMVELLARLEGELNKDGADDGARGISVIVIRGDGAIDPAEFRRRADARMALEVAGQREERIGDPDG